MIKLTIIGQTPSKKGNPSIVINQKTGKYMIIPNKYYRKWIKDTLPQLEAAHDGPTITDEVEVKAIIFRHGRRKADLINILQSIHDALQEAGIIEDDFLIASVDGSRLILGVPKDEARAEIEISLFQPY